MPEVSAPVIPDNEVKLTDFGAVGDGIALNTEAFRKAIDALSQKGGGKLIVPQGVWHTGPIVLKSNIELHLRAGAVILFAADESVYSHQSMPMALPILPSPVRALSMVTDSTGALLRKRK